MESINLAKYIDHTLLKSDAKTVDIQTLCQEAVELSFYSVCVNTSFVGLAKAMLQNSSVKICATVGFPLGATSTPTKAFEADDAIKNGADEIDMVMNIGAFKEADYEFVTTDIATVVSIAQSSNISVKVIIETCLLSDAEIIKASSLAINAGAAFVKTSTGFSSAGATLDAVRLIKSVVLDKGQVKASGGIKTKEDALRFIEAGADRIGTSNGVDMVK